MTTLSLAMIVKDEAQRLGHCLDSVQGLVDEVVVVDTGSSDGTRDLALRHGARVIDFPWVDDFAAARNESLRHCNGDWVLVLDADEAIDPRDHASIRQAIAQPRIHAYHLTLRSYVLDGDALFLGQPVTPNDRTYQEGAEYGHFGDAPGLRLFRRFPDLKYRGRIHELITPYFVEKRLTIATLPAVIHHYGKVEASRETPKAAYYLRLARDEAVRTPQSPQTQFNLMTQASIAGEWDLALEAAQAFARLDRKGHPSLGTTLALAHLHAERWSEAVPILQRLLREQPGHPLALRHLARALAGLGRAEEAMTWLREQVLLHPRDESLRDQLIALDLQQEQHARAAADAWEALRALPSGGGGHWHALVAAFLMNAGQTAQGGAVIALGLQAFPGHEGLQRLARAGAPD